MPIIAIDVPNADLTKTTLDTNESGQAVFTFPDAPLTLPDGGKAPTAKEYEANCAREARLLVEAALQAAPAPAKTVTLNVDVPAEYAAAAE